MICRAGGGNGRARRVAATRLFESVLIFGGCLCVLVAELSAGDWPHWRGPHRDGVVASGSGWDGTHWIAATPTWQATVGEGASSPLLVADQVFAFGHRAKQEVVSCLDARTGKLIWNATYAAPKYGRHAVGDEGMYSGPSATPEFDTATGLLYTLGVDGELSCWDAPNAGERVWSRNLYDDYQMPRRAKVGRSGQRDYGYTSAPLLHGNWLLVEVGSPRGTVIAFDKRTGTEVWRSRANSVAGHTGGMAPIVVEGVPCVAVMTFDGLLVVRLDGIQAGETVATFPWITDFANNIASPAVHDDCVLITSAYNQDSLCKLRITLRGAEKVWDQPVPSKVCTPVIHGGRVYMAWNRLQVLEWQDGRTLHTGPLVGDAGSCVVTADEKLIVWAGRGELFLVDVSGNEAATYRELARIRQLAASDVWPHLVVTGERLLCRDRAGKLMSFALMRD